MQEVTKMKNDNVKKFLAGLSLFSLIGGANLLHATNLDNDKIVIAKSG